MSSFLGGRHDFHSALQNCFKYYKALTITGVIANCDGWHEIEDFCCRKEDWLRERTGLALEHAIPSATFFERVRGQNDPEAFEKCFAEWTGQVHKKTIGEVISVDGKTAHSSRNKDRQPIHMISAWASEQELVLGQMCVEEKTNEIPTVPLLLELLDISGCIVTADAMSCQRETARKIMDGKADYVLSLKYGQLYLFPSPCGGEL